MKAFILVVLLAGCAALNQPNADNTLTDDELRAVIVKAFQAGYWAGWKNANREAGHGL